jgi:hypothetical protein
MALNIFITLLKIFITSYLLSAVVCAIMFFDILAQMIMLILVGTFVFTGLLTVCLTPVFFHIIPAVRNNRVLLLVITLFLPSVVSIVWLVDAGDDFGWRAATVIVFFIVAIFYFLMLFRREPST